MIMGGAKLNRLTRQVAQRVLLIAFISAIAFGCDDTSKSSTNTISGAGKSGASGTAGKSGNKGSQTAKAGAGGAKAGNAGTTATAGAGGGSAIAGAPAAGSGPNRASAGNGASGAGGASGVNGASGQSGQTGVKACVNIAAGVVVCDLQNVLYRCDGNGNAVSSEPCKDEPSCRAGKNSDTCGICKPGDYQCTAAVLEKCNDSGQWAREEDCSSPELCSVINRSCGACKPNAYKCEDGKLYKCPADQTDWQPVTNVGNFGDCGSQELCDADLGKCKVCAPNAVECDKQGKNVVMTCSADGYTNTPAPCTGNTPYCQDKACVECKDPEDCEVTNECLESTCTNGTCGTGTGLTGNDCKTILGKDGICTAGLCSQCTAINTSKCGPAQQCNLITYTCEDMPALSASSFVAGTYTVTISPAYRLSIKAQGFATTGSTETVTVYNGFSSVCTLSATRTSCTLQKYSQATSLTITGPSSTLCQPNPSQGEEIVIGFGSGCVSPELTLTALK